MDFVTTGLFGSFALLIALWVLFRYEAQRGVRIGERFRQYIDFGVYKMHYRLERISWFLGRDFLRQVFHYLFHTVLRFVLLSLKRCEDGLKNIMRVNKTLAKNAERENMTRTKLEEIALHKAAHALTEEEKKAHKDKILQG